MISCGIDWDSVAIHGAHPLKGAVVSSGAKNSVSKIIAAAMLTDDACELINFPLIGETVEAFSLVESVFGAQLKRLSERTFNVQCGTGKGLANAIRALLQPMATRIPLILVAPQLRKFGKAFIPRRMLGDPIGPRPIDFLLAGYVALGAVVYKNPRGYFISAPHGLRGTAITLPFSSVSATANLTLAATIADGITVVRNAAIDPEIVDMVRCLCGMGACIDFDASQRILTIEGGKKLHGNSHTLIPDRQVAASFAIAAIASGGDITVHGINIADLHPVLKVLKQCGAGIEVFADRARFYRMGELRAIMIESGPFPEFPSDCLPQMALMLTQAHGTSILHETVFEARMNQLSPIVAAGAHIKIRKLCPDDAPCRFNGKRARHLCEITGPTPIVGGHMRIVDLRAGFTYLLAGSLSDSWSFIDGVRNLQRGYENVLSTFQSLGADIQCRRVARAIGFQMPRIAALG